MDCRSSENKSSLHNNRPHITFSPTIELAEGGQSGRSHPYDEVLICHSFNRRYLIRIRLVKVLRGVIVGIVEQVLLAVRDVGVAQAGGI